MKKILSDSLRDFTLLAVACLVLGVLLLFFPGASGRVICSLCAIALIVYGGIHVVLYFLRKAPEDLFRHDFAKGLICLLLGVYLLMRPAFLMGVLPVVLGIVVLGDSIIRLQKSFDLVRLGDSLWWVVLLLAIATGILGVLMLVNPFGAAATLLRFIGLGLVLSGVSDLWTMFSLRHWVKDTARLIKDEISGIETTEYTVEDADRQDGAKD